MTFLDLAKKRYTSRGFLLKPIPSESLLYVLEAARVAPTMGNTQSQRIIVLDTRKNLRKLSLHVSFHDAPLVFLICADTRASFKDPVLDLDSAVVDASVVATHMVLAAADEGLGTTWVAKFSNEKVKAMFNLPTYLKVVHIVAMGFSTHSKSPDRHGLERLPLAKMVTVLKESE